MYSLAVQPIIVPSIRNKMVRNEPKTKLTANIVLTPGNYFSFPCIDGKLKIDSYFPSQKANHLFKDNMKWLCLLSFTSIKQKFNTTILVVVVFIYVKI